jgi:hypothetical protein
VCLAGLVLAIVPSSAAAQGEDSEWASSSGGHMAFTTSEQDTGVSTLRFVGADGVLAPREVVTDGHANRGRWGRTGPPWGARQRQTSAIRWWRVPLSA